MQASITDHRSGIAVLHLRGELDADTAATLHAVLADLLERPMPRIVVDVSQLKFCDSIGLSEFVTSKEVLTARGGWLSFAGANPFLACLLGTVGLSRYFALFPDVAEALAGSGPGLTKCERLLSKGASHRPAEGSADR